MQKRAAFFSGLLLSTFLVAQAFPQNRVATKNVPDSKNSSAVKNNNPVTGEQIERDISEALTIIQDKYVSDKKLDYNELFKSSIDSMLHTLDPHSNYFDAKEYEEFRTEQSSQYFGIGASIASMTDPNGKVVATYIRATFDGAPANRAGLRYGDKILDVNGTSMLGKPSSEVRTFLIGARGTTAKVTVEHYGGKRETVDIVRDAVPQPSVPEAYMIRPGVGYISMMRSNFTQTTYSEFRRAMADLKAQGMQNLILDLRDNGGGLVNQALNVANTFLSNGQVIFTQKGRLDDFAQTYPAQNTNPDQIPIVMLVNGNTASASEILAGALQDHDRALIVGETTFGKGLVQLPMPIEYGSMLLLTIAKYQTPSGRLIQRDYSNGDYYSYYSHGGTLADDSKPAAPTGEKSKTDTGRAVYGGGGITPDDVIKPQTISSGRFNSQQELAVGPIFAFAMDLAYGRVPGFESYKVDRPIKYDYDLKPTDFPITDDLFQTFKKYAMDRYKTPVAQIDREKEFIERYLRTELATAAYGTTTANQVSRDYDNQLKRAVDDLPRAKQLASESAKVYAEQKLRSQDNR